MNLTIKSKTLELILFYFSYLFILAFSIMGHINDIGGLLNTVSKFSIAFLGLLIIINIKKFNKREIMLSLILLILSFINLYLTKDFTLLKLVLIILCIKSIDFNTLIKYDAYLRFFLILCVFVLLKLGIASDVISYNDGFYKHSLGFSNPNALGMHSFILALEILYLNWKNMNVFKYVVLLIPMFLLNNYIGCRTTLWIFIVTVIIKKIMDSNNALVERKSFKFIVSNIFVIMLALTFVMFALYENNYSIGIKLNDVLSHRLYNMHVYFSNFNISLFGANITYNLTLDTFYAYSLLGYGLINTIIIAIAFNKLLKLAFQNKRYDIVLIFAVFAVYGISERVWFLVDYNIFMVFFSYLIFNDKFITDINNQVDI